MKKMPASQPVLPNDITAEILVSLQPISPSAKRRQAMKSQLFAASVHAKPVTVRAATYAGASTWVTIAPKIEMQVLYDDGIKCERMVRFAPGAISFGHVHRHDESALVIQGCCTVGQIALGTGDYHMVPAGVAHGDIVSIDGCILFLNGPSMRGQQSNRAQAR